MTSRAVTTLTSTPTVAIWIGGGLLGLAGAALLAHLPIVPWIIAVLFGWNLSANLVVPDLGALPVAVSGAAVLLLLARRAGIG